MPTKVILDTDIGDDIDDAYALALILASAELELLGVTTVFRNTEARARQARTVLQVAGRPEIPVAAGCGATLSTRIEWPPRQRQQVQNRSLPTPAADQLNGLLPCQDESCLPEGELPPPDPRHGVDFLVETLMAGGGDIVPITIGPLTNLAMALVKEPRLALQIPHIVTMGGCFDRQQSEWNIKCDPVAAAIVCHSGVPMTLVGLDVTTKCHFSHDQVERLCAGTRPVARNLAAATRAWQGRGGGGWKQGRPVLHDPLAVETLIRPDLVQMRQGTVTVELSGADTYGYTILHPAPPETAARHQIGVTVAAEEALELWLDRVLAL